MIVLVNPTNNMPYGLMYIASFLRKHGVECEIRDYIKKIHKKVCIFDGELRRVLDGTGDIVGISSMFTENKDKVLSWASWIKEYTGAKIVLGGNYASTHAEELIKLSFIDHVVVGEGEQAMLDIVNGCKEPIVKRPMLPIDDIPMPAYDLIDVPKYLKNQNPFSMRKSIGIISSRGCPNNCAYCSIGAVWGRSWRGFSPKRVVDEMKYLQKTYDVHEFSFLDDSMSINAKRLENICQDIIKRNLNIKWTTPNGIAHWTLTDRLLSSMKDSGCYRITFGIESGSSKIRKYIKKEYSLKQASGLIKYANNIGLWTICTNIIGLPYETWEDMYKTERYAIDCDTDFACFYKLIPHEGTQVYKDIDKIKYNDDELTLMQRCMYRKFLINRIWSSPLRLIRKIHSWEDFLYAMKLIKLGFKILLNTFKKGGHILYG